MNKQTIDEFILIDHSTLVPRAFEAKANPFNGHSAECPYFAALMRTRATIVFNKEQADKLIKSHEHDYCWNNCSITDCPTYVQEKDSND